MNINIKNLGPIKEFNFDFSKDLHLLFGKSGVGKSYAVYCIFITLKKLTASGSFRIDSSEGFLTDNIYSKNSDFAKLNKGLINALNQQKSVEINIDKYLKGSITYFFQETFVRNLQNAFLNTYPSSSALRNRFNINEPLLISLSLQGLSFSISLNNEHKLEIKEVLLNRKYSVSYKYNKKNLYDNYSIFIDKALSHELSIGYRDDNRVNILEEITKIIVNKLTQEIKKIIRGVYFLPASRSGLYQGLNSLTPLIAQLSKHRFQLRTTTIELPSLSEPLADYYLNLSTISSKNFNNEAIQNIAKLIEKEILNGKVEYDEENSKIFYTPNKTDLKLEMSQSSSMVAEISPIITFLKHIVNVNINTQQLDLFSFPEEKPLISNKSNYDIIIIEEPEAHMHPESQIILIEIFTGLSKNNIKLIMTSHSNYMFDKLYNMLLEERISPDKVETYHMIMTDEGSVVNPEMHVTKEGIEDDNFLKVSEDLFEERMRIYDAKNQELDNAS